MFEHLHGKDKAQATKKLKVVSRLTIAAKKDLDIPKDGDITGQQFAHWMIGMKPEWSKNTLKQYKHCIISSAQHFNNQRLIERIKAIDYDGCKAGKRSWLKCVPLEMQLAIEETLLDRADRGEYYARAAFLLFHQTINLGLRPIEWPSLESLGGLTFKVRNAKDSHGRAHGRYRCFKFPGTVDRGLSRHHEGKLFKQALTLLGRRRGSRIGWPLDSGEWTKDWAVYYKALKDTLRRTLRQLAKATGNQDYLRIRFYSCRHQFCANQKQAGLSLVEIAALMGHATDATASQYYGKRAHGRRRWVQINAHERDMANVRRVYKGRTEKRPTPKATKGPK